MASRVDTVVLGGGSDGLMAAIGLAVGGSKVVLLEAAAALGGVLQEIEFAPGFRAAPLARDAGWIPPEVVRVSGLSPGDLVVPDPAVLAPLESGGWLTIRPDPGATAAGLERFSRADAGRWRAFAGRVHRIARFLESLYRGPAPEIDASGWNELWGLVRAGRKLRGLGRDEMVEVLRTVPMAAAELLDEWFEHDRLKAALAAGAVAELCQGPMSGGTAFNLLHRHVGNPLGAIGGRPAPREGPGSLIDRLARVAERHGVTIRTGERVDSILVDDDRVAGVRLASGGEIAAGEVMSTLDPRATLLALLDPIHLDPEFILAVRNIRFRGAEAKVLLALDGLPDLPLAAGPGSGAAISIAPSVTYLERAYDATKYGEWSAEPALEVRVPSLARPELAPPGKHVMVLHVQYAPYALRGRSWEAERGALGDRAIATLDRFTPGLSARIRHRAVLTPVDLEAEFGLSEGAVSQGEMMLDQILFMRPVAGWARYATPVPGLYLCGAGTHPGGGVTGMSGWLAARELLRARNEKRAGAAGAGRRES